METFDLSSFTMLSDAVRKEILKIVSQPDYHPQKTKKFLAPIGLTSDDVRPLRWQHLCHCIEQDAQGFFSSDAVVGTSITFAEIAVTMSASVSLFSSRDAAFYELLTPATLAR